VAGGTLVVSRWVKLHNYIKKRLEILGFPNVTVTGAGYDGLTTKVREIKPRIVIIGADFYQCSTPYMMKELLRVFPKLNIAALTIGGYPADLAKDFITYGVRSYLNFTEGPEQFYEGLEEVKQGREYISPDVKLKREADDSCPVIKEKISPRHMEIIRLACNGFTALEAGRELGISKRTVENHKNDIYLILGVGNEYEMIRTVLQIGLVKLDELCFHPEDR
jgi:DNA-binding NarL/FixJ family response regulator